MTFRMTASNIIPCQGYSTDVCVPVSKLPGVLTRAREAVHREGMWGKVNSYIILDLRLSLYVEGACQLLQRVLGMLFSADTVYRQIRYHRLRQPTKESHFISGPEET